MAKTLPDFIRWLESRFKRLQEKWDHPDPDEGIFRDSARCVSQAGNHARYFGAGHLAIADRELMAPQDAMAVIGRMLAWAREQSPSDGPLTIPQAAERLGVSTRAVYDLVKAGKLRHQRIGNGRGTIRVLAEYIEAFQRESRADTAAPGLRHLDL